MDGERIGTIFFPLKHELKGKKRWILAVPCQGELWLEDNAVRSVRDKKKSVWATGIVKVS